MSSKMKSFFKMFFSNTEVTKAYKFPMIFIVLLLFVNVSLISVPNFYGKMDSVNTISNLEGIEEALELIYEDQLDCVLVDTVMDCNIVNGTMYGNYEVRFDDEMDLSDVDSSTIYFSKDVIVFVYVDDLEMAYTISGDYSLLDTFDFTEISTNDTGELTRQEYYGEINDLLLSGIFFSTLSQQLGLIYVSQFMQVFIYLIFITLIIMLMNFKAPTKKVTFINANKIIIASMTGPAFLVAILGMIIPTWASIMFFIIFAIRVMMLYYKMNFSDVTYLD